MSQTIREAFISSIAARLANGDQSALVQLTDAKLQTSLYLSHVVALYKADSTILERIKRETTTAREANQLAEHSAGESVELQAAMVAHAEWLTNRPEITTDRRDGHNYLAVKIGNGRPMRHRVSKWKQIARHWQVIEAELQRLAT